ncbi:glycosyltransferase family 92 protein [Microbulbifer rhizosphaerae]|uniref:Glycosyltransferase involved in cell wall biosynthesis n=1 Tax=Microbulbifer rhizosphaerae TaxID=1562603 RepID=A0A7W4Z9S5_9GAMM|nr:glycosyltransferase family 92 protein [Microbulbifer rhizosphaerae]MBB3061886.1 glycosyltransferase involved in cell wall biosynthesis [Microbulbifer rhizosphaerae]
MTKGSSVIFPQFTVGLAAIVKNEIDYILEWISYHQNMGVDKFYIADNCSDDGTSQVLEALHNAGVITRIYFPRVGDTGPQAPAYNQILRDYGPDVDLLAFIDIDEFIFSTNGKSLKENLTPFYQNPEAGALALNWRNFGSSGHVFKEEGPVIERFIRCSRKEHKFNKHIKTILKPSMVARMNIHECSLKEGRYYSANMQPAGFENGEAFEPRTAEVSYEALRINHYVVKSRQEHFLNKDRKGSGAGSASRRKGQAYFQGHDLNDEVDEGMLPYVSAVKARIQELKNLLVHDSPYMSFGQGHVTIRGNIVSGWAVSEFTGNLKIRLLINGVEQLVDVDRERPDVIGKRISQKLVCGFWYQHDRELTEEDRVSATIYGSNVECQVNRA